MCICMQCSDELRLGIGRNTSCMCSGWHLGLYCFIREMWFVECSCMHGQHCKTKLLWHDYPMHVVLEKGFMQWELITTWVNFSQPETGILVVMPLTTHTHTHTHTHKWYILREISFSSWHTLWSFLYDSLAESFFWCVDICILILVNVLMFYKHYTTFFELAWEGQSRTQL